MPITYQALAEAVHLSPPNTIRQVTDALEELIAQDAATGAPLIAALVVSKTRGGLPAPGFFDYARFAGRIVGDLSPAETKAFHAAECKAARAYWCRP